MAINKQEGLVCPYLLPFKQTAYVPAANNIGAQTKRNETKRKETIRDCKQQKQNQHVHAT